MNKQHTTPGGQQGKAAKVKDKVGDATEQVRETASHVTSGARDRGEHMIAEGKEKVHELGDRAETAARSRAEQEKYRVANGIRTFADALRRGSNDLSGDRDQFRPLLNGAADRAERLSNLLESRDVDALTSDVRRFAREHTSLFVGGAFALGFLGARFLKSSEERALEAGSDDVDSLTGYEREDRFDRMLPESDTRQVRTSAASFDTVSRTYETDSTRQGGGYE